MAGAMSTYDVTLADLPLQHTAVVCGHVPHDGVAEFLGEAFGEVMTALGRAGRHPSGMPFARYQVTEDGFDIEAGFPVAEPFEPPSEAGGRVESSTLPAGHAARVLHQGGYAEVAAAYEAAERWIAENAMRPSAAPWEMYLDEPGVAAPRTEVFMPCVEAHR